MDLLIQRTTKKYTDVTPSGTIIDFEELDEKSGSMKYMEIIDNRPRLHDFYSDLIRSRYNTVLTEWW